MRKSKASEVVREVRKFKASDVRGMKKSKVSDVRGGKEVYI